MVFGEWGCGGLAFFFSLGICRSWGAWRIIAGGNPGVYDYLNHLLVPAE